MLFDNARLEAGECVRVHAGGSGIGTAAIKMAKAIGATVITTVGDDAKVEKAKALGADHVINYRTDRFEGVVRKLTAKKGVDVVFEHVGAETFNGSLLCLKRGGRLVTCGATSGASTTLNLMQLCPAAISHHRIVRRLRQHHARALPRWRRNCARHRHRAPSPNSSADSRGSKRACSADHREFLSPCLPCPMSAVLRGKSRTG
jgi:NADPH:quinone reductase-like Zn-dependent oxidoreductase